MLIEPADWVREADKLGPRIPTGGGASFSSGYLLQTLRVCWVSGLHSKRSVLSEESAVCFIAYLIVATIRFPLRRSVSSVFSVVDPLGSPVRTDMIVSVTEKVGNL